MGKTLLIVGAGTEQIPAYLKARERGFTVVASDALQTAPAVKFADHFILASTRDAQATADAAAIFHQKHPIDGVMTIANDVPLTVSTVARRLNLKSISVNAAEAASNKLLMKDLFKQQDVACPWYQEVHSSDELKTIFRERQQTLVIKPIDGRGARGVLLLDHSIDLDWAFAESKRWGDSGRVMIEQFIPGLQLSTESFILNGKCFTAAIAERNYQRLLDFKPYIIEDGGTIPAPLDKALEARIDSLILSGAKAMGITEGIVKGDLVIDPDGQPLIIELAARLSGGWFATHQIPFASGVDLVNAVISYALDLPIEEKSLIPSKAASTAIRYWFPSEGVIESIEGESQLKSMSELLAYGFFRKEGDRQPQVKMHPDRFGYVIATGANRSESISAVERALRAVRVKTRK